MFKIRVLLLKGFKHGFWWLIYVIWSLKKPAALNILI